MDYTKLKKDELLLILENKDNEIERLQNDVEYWENEYEDMEIEKEDLEKQVDELSYDNAYGIKDVNKFLDKLSSDDLNLYDKIKPYIDYYLRYYNE